MTETAGVTVYYCDPEKNTECRKRICAHCLTITEGGICFITRNREFARTDANGEPVIYTEQSAGEIVKE